MSSRTPQSTSTGAWGRARWGLGAVLVSALAIGLLGAATQAPGGTAQNPPGVAKARAAYRAALKPWHWVKIGPGFNARKARGKTVWYVSLDQSIPALQVVVANLRKALGLAGVKLVVCDGQSNPSSFVRCMDSAIAQKANVIIDESIDPKLISASIQKAKQAHIPVIDGDNADPSAPLQPGISARVAFPYTKSQRLVADWVIADSNGKANVLLVYASDYAGDKYVRADGLLYEFKRLCPGCKITQKAITFANLNTGLGPLTRSALLENPSINYIVPVFDLFTIQMSPAIKQAGAQNRVKIATYNGSLYALQDMAMSSGNLIYADVGSEQAYLGWAFADQAMRLLTKTRPLKNERVPFRMFTRENVGKLRLTRAAEVSGEWFGPRTFNTKYPQLWGLRK
jgi:ribose transport system substrate-binding protein